MTAQDLDRRIAKVLYVNGIAPKPQLVNDLLELLDPQAAIIKEQQQANKKLIKNAASNKPKNVPNERVSLAKITGQSTDTNYKYNKLLEKETE